MSETKQQDKGRARGWGHHLLTPIALAGLCCFCLPLVALATRTSRARWKELLSSDQIREALQLSLSIATAALVLSVALGLPTAWLLARSQIPGRRLLRTLLTLPMVLPPVVAGVALLATFGRSGLLGPSLAALGVQLPFSRAGAVVAATFVAAPFLIITAEAAFARVDPRLEAAAATLGATRWRVLWSVTLPQARPALIAGMVLCWARALGEFGATITFAGNLPGHTQTMPLAVYERLQDNPDAAVVLSLLLLGVSTLILFALRGQLRPSS